MNNLKFLRTNADLTLREVREYTHITHSVTFSLENEERTFRETHIKAYCDFFNCSSDFLLGKSNTGIFVETKKGFVAIDKETYLTNKLKGNLKEYIDCGKIWRVPTDELERELCPSLDDEVYASIIAELKDMTESELKRVLKFIKEFIKIDT